MKCPKCGHDMQERTLASQHEGDRLRVASEWLRANRPEVDLTELSDLLIIETYEEEFVKELFGEGGKND